MKSRSFKAPLCDEKISNSKFLRFFLNIIYTYSALLFVRDLNIGRKYVVLPQVLTF